MGKTADVDHVGQHCVDFVAVAVEVAFKSLEEFLRVVRCSCLSVKQRAAPFLLGAALFHALIMPTEKVILGILCLLLFYSRHQESYFFHIGVCRAVYNTVYLSAVHYGYSVGKGG